MFRILLSLFLIATPCSLAIASPHEELAKTQKEIDSAKSHGKKLDDDAGKLSKKISALSKEIVKTAAALQASEAKLSTLEEKLKAMDEQITLKTNNLAQRKKELALMVQASVKLSQTPPEAIIIMPGNMMDNMKASRALKMTTDNIKRESESIRLQMVELEQLKGKLEESKQSADQENKKLEQQRDLLKTQMAELDTMRKKLNAERKENKARTQTLAKKAEDLKGLIASLELEKKLEEKRERERKIKEKDKEDVEEIENDDRKPEGARGRLRSFRDAKGNIRVPAAGKLVQRFGAEGRNETSKGITIATRDNAQVTAPYDAEVLFSGVFMEYGRMIILRHSDGFHTLIAGMSKIDASVGDFLLEGEPIGAMGDGEENNRLYVELRSNNQPVNPVAWLRGLRK